MELKEWVRAARQYKGLTQEKLGDELGVTKGNVSGWENGRHEPGYSQLLKISELTGYPLDMSTVREPGVTYGLQPILAWEYQEDLPDGEFVFIPRLDVHLSAGNGHEQLAIDFDRKEPVAFRADWIRKKRLKPRYLATMYASGDSMEDRIFDGDLLAIDTSQRDVRDGGVYALWYDGGERVKRLFRLPGGGLRIHSDNEHKYPDIVLAPGDLEHVRIIGRVVHQSGTGGL